ncbi:ABC transporter ATP-binding protein [Clostridiaceae bacterium 35-E11]
MFQFQNVKYKNILDIKQLTIPNNTITCIVGESGSGKTTLLRLLNKMISCTEGKIYYNNTSLDTIDSIRLRRNVMMLPQVPVIFNGTVKDNLLIGLKFSEKNFPEDVALLNVLDMVHLHKSLDETAENLSGGEKQRLALGRIILNDPEIFLLDEPSSALDENTEKIIIEQLVHHTKQKNKTLIMVTHSKKIAQSYGDHIIIIKQGSIFDDKEEC